MPKPFSDTWYPLSPFTGASPFLVGFYIKPSVLLLMSPIVRTVPLMAKNPEGFEGFPMSLD